MMITRFFSWIAVLVYAGGLAYLLSRGFFLSPVEVGVWDALDLRSVASSLKVAAAQLSLESLGFVGLGVASAAAWLRPYPATQDEPRRPKGLVRWLTASVLALALTAGLLLAVQQTIPTTIELLLTGTCVLVGTWCGWWWFSGARARRWLLAQLLVGMALVSFVAYRVAGVVISRERRVPPAQRVPSAEKRRVMALLRGSRINEASDRRLVLRERDLNSLINMGTELSKDSMAAAAHIRPGERVDLAATVKLPIPKLTRFVNIELSLWGVISEGDVEFQCQRLAIGKFEAPRAVTKAISYFVKNALVRDRELRQLVARTESFRIEEDSVVLVGNWAGMRKQITGRLMAEMGAQPEIAPTVRIYVRHLLDREEGLDIDGQTLPIYLRFAFALAADRSAAGADPAFENRAALLALGMLLGHPKVERLIGDVMLPELRAKKETVVGRVTLRGRRDWTQHFLVSASLALVANRVVSDAAGLLKEELDAGEGGSGFSFTDLGADMAGTRLAVAATKDARSARRVQAILARLESPDPIVPPLADLPEGIPDAEFQSLYGGVDGAGYRRVLIEIERRLANCSALATESK